MTKHAHRAPRAAYQPRGQRRHPVYFDEGTWSRSELLRLRERTERERVTRHQAATPTSLAR